MCKKAKNHAYCEALPKLCEDERSGNKKTSAVSLSQQILVHAVVEAYECHSVLLQHESASGSATRQQMTHQS